MPIISFFMLIFIISVSVERNMKNFEEDSCSDETSCTRKFRCDKEGTLFYFWWFVSGNCLKIFYSGWLWIFTLNVKIKLYQRRLSLLEKQSDENYFHAKMAEFYEDYSTHVQ